MTADVGDDADELIRASVAASEFPTRTRVLPEAALKAVEEWPRLA
jgi:hypothetical protein